MVDVVDLSLDYKPFAPVMWITVLIELDIFSGRWLFIYYRYHLIV
jgi:hypothetical protein